MKKYIIIAAIAVLILSILGGAGFFAYKMYSELAEFRSLGTLEEMKGFSQENFDLKKQNKKLTKSVNDVEKGFIKYRKEFLTEAERRAQRKVELAKASFVSVSGPYVLIAASTQEQLEICKDTQKLIELEIALFNSNDPSSVMKQGTICNTYIERSLIPLFKYQMLRLRTSMTGSLGHLRKEAEKKFADARTLLDSYDIPVTSEVEAYTRFNNSSR